MKFIKTSLKFIQYFYMCVVSTGACMAWILMFVNILWPYQPFQEWMHKFMRLGLASLFPMILFIIINLIVDEEEDE